MAPSVRGLALGGGGGESHLQAALGVCSRTLHSALAAMSTTILDEQLQTSVVLVFFS